jgi:hypothetical protein
MGVCNENKCEILENQWNGGMNFIHVFQVKRSYTSTQKLVERETRNETDFNIPW